MSPANGTKVNATLPDATITTSSSSSSPTNTPTTTTSKRKRSPSITEHTSHPEPLATASVKTEEDESSRIQSTIRDLWTILKSNDTDPSTLDRLISVHTPNDRRAKRAKLALSISPESIATRIEKNAYSRIEDFTVDFDTACKKLIEEAKPSTDGTQWRYVPGDLDQDRLIAHVQAAQKLLRSLVMRDAAMRPVNTNHLAQIKQEEESTPSPNLVLTLYGNAQGHKQLFSSLQHAVGANIHGSQPVMKLRENGLPNGIMSTMIVPIEPKDAAANLKRNTFKDVFGPSPSLPPLVPPQPSKQTHSSSTIVWGAVRERRPERPIGYAYQKLTAGQWLGYGGSTPISGKTDSGMLGQPSTLSTNDQSSSEDERALAEEEALFRSLYSSFAPSRDNTGAVYSEYIKNEMWWQKVGRQALEDSLDMSPDDVVSSIDASDSMAIADTDEDKMKQYAEAVENFDPALEDFNVDSASQGQSNEDETILDEISQLIESLHSYQRIRNMSHKPKSTNLQPSSSNQGMFDDVPGPSEVEIETYNTLRAQLALVVATLPPYAVSRLNGDQLEDLNISLKMPIEDKNIRGVMEEDAQSRATKAAALSAAIGIAANSNRAAALATPGAGARTAPMGGGRNTQSYTATTGPNLLRQTSQLGSRQPLNGWQTPTQQSLSATASRRSFQNQAAYSTQNAKPAYNNNYRNTTVGQFQSTSNRQANTPGKNSYTGIGSTGHQPRATPTNFNYPGQAAQQAPMTISDLPQTTSQTGQYQQRPSYLAQPIQVGSPVVGGQAAGDSRSQTPGMVSAMRSVSSTPQPGQAQI